MTAMGSISRGSVPVGRAHVSRFDHPVPTGREPLQPQTKGSRLPAPPLIVRFPGPSKTFPGNKLSPEEHRHRVAERCTREIEKIQGRLLADERGCGRALSSYELRKYLTKLTCGNPQPFAS